MEEVCTVAGDGDLYGIGVRIGLYFQWVAGLLLRNMDGSWRTISQVRTSNMAISTALNLCVAINTVRGVSLSIDYLIVYYLTIALFYSESYNLTSKTTEGGINPRPRKGYRYILKPDAALVAQNVLFSSTTLFGVWFWLRGVFTLQSPECHPAYGALLATFELQDGRWRYFAASFGVIGGAILALILHTHVASLVSENYHNQPVARVGLAAARFFEPASGGVNPFDRYPESFLRPRLKSRTMMALVCSTFHWLIMNVVGPVIAVTSIERMLVANRVATSAILDSSGQMIALLTGIVSLCLAIWDIGRIFVKDTNIDLLASHTYLSRKPLSKQDMEQSLIGVVMALESYDDSGPNNVERLSDEHICSELEMLFKKVETWSARCKEEVFAGQFRGEDKTGPAWQQDSVLELLRQLQHIEGHEKLGAVLEDGEQRDVFVRDLVARFLCHHVFRTQGTKDSPNPRAQDYWVSRDLRDNFQALETEFFCQGQQWSGLGRWQNMLI
jgi:hypothetical protein